MGGKEVEIRVSRKLGDEQSNLLDKFERLSFEVHLNRAILGRSLSEPGTIGRHNHPKLVPQPRFLASCYQTLPTPPGLVSQVSQGRRGRPGFLKKLIKPIFGFRRWRSNNNGGKSSRDRHSVVMDPKDPRFWKAFSRSLRF